MDTRTPKKSNTDSWISGISILIFVCSMALLLDEKFIFRGVGSQNNLTPIAQVIHHRNDVRRRFDSDVIWLPVQKQDVVFENESIFTGDSSGIEIKFDSDNTKISLDSKTLIKLTNTNKKNNLNVLHGRIKVTLGSKKNVVFKIAGKIYDFSAPQSQTGQTSFQIEAPADEKSAPKIDVTSGTLEILDIAKEQEKTVVSENQSVEIPHDAASISSARSLASIDTAETSPPAQDIPQTQVVESQENQRDQNQASQLNSEKQSLITKNTIPTPIPSSSPLPASNPKEDKPFSVFSLQPHFSNSIMSVTDASTGMSCELVSKVNMGLDLSWAQKWSQTFESDLSFGFSKYEYEEPSTRALNNSSLMSSHTSLSGFYRMFEFTRLGLTAMESQQVFIRALSNTLLTIDRQWVSSLASNITQDLIRSGALSFGMGAEFGAFLPKSADAYNIKTGYFYGGDLFVVHVTDKGKIGAVLLYESKTQDTTIVKQKTHELSLALTFSLNFGN